MSQENQKTSLWDSMTKNTAPQERRDRLLGRQSRARLERRDGSRFAATPRQGANRAMPINAIELASPQSIAGQMLHRKMGGSPRPVWVMAPLRQVLSWRGDDCGRMQSCVWPVGSAILTTAGPDVVREAGPNQSPGLDTRAPKKVLPPRRPTDQHHAISTSATRDAYDVSSCSGVAIVHRSSRQSPHRQASY